MRAPTVGRFGGMPVSMTPMIDVGCQLLIFFMCTASFREVEQVLPSTLPATQSTHMTPSREVQELEVIQVQLAERDGGLVMWLNGEPCADLATLRARLQQLSAVAVLPAVLDPAPEVQLGNVVAVYDLCLATGMRDIRFAARER